MCDPRRSSPSLAAPGPPCRRRRRQVELFRPCPSCSRPPTMVATTVVQVEIVKIASRTERGASRTVEIVGKVGMRESGRVYVVKAGEWGAEKLRAMLEAR